MKSRSANQILIGRLREPEVPEIRLACRIISASELLIIIIHSRSATPCYRDCGFVNSDLVERTISGCYKRHLCSWHGMFVVKPFYPPVWLCCSGAIYRNV